MLREERGITLVALMITIIVLIILAAVTIMSLTESNIINTAVNGTLNYANSQSWEINELAKTDDMLNKKVQKIEEYISKQPQ
ncbi:MAG: hypothetical protein HFJ50_08120 [Clostridia bacterium]|jgi:cell division septal protein FtsQ|nr:hypothetical protein [Clostridia bacterium]